MIPPSSHVRLLWIHIDIVAVADAVVVPVVAVPNSTVAILISVVAITVPSVSVSVAVIASSAVAVAVSVVVVVGAAIANRCRGGCGKGCRKRQVGRG